MEWGGVVLGGPETILMRGTFSPVDSPAAPVTSPGGSLISNLWDSSEQSCPEEGRGLREVLKSVSSECRGHLRVPLENWRLLCAFIHPESIFFSSQQVLFKTDLALWGIRLLL